MDNDTSSALRLLAPIDPRREGGADFTPGVVVYADLPARARSAFADTVALLMADQASLPPEYEAVAKIAVLAGSAVAAALGALVPLGDRGTAPGTLLAPNAPNARIQVE